MKQETELLRSDYFWATCWLPLRQPRYFAFVPLIWVITLGIGLIRDLPKTGYDLFLRFFGTVLFSLPTIAAMAVFWVLYSVFVSISAAAPLGKHLYEVSDDGLGEENEACRLLTHWSYVKGLKLTERHLIINLKDSRFHVLPRRCFDSNEQLHEFYRAVKAQLGQPDDFPLMRRGASLQNRNRIHPDGKSKMTIVGNN